MIIPKPHPETPPHPSPLPRRLLLAATFLILPAWGFYNFYPWDKYRYSIERLRGKTEAEVIEAIGPPIGDSREDGHHEATSPEFNLGFASRGGGFGMRHTVYFERGVVVRVDSYMK